MLFSPVSPKVELHLCLLRISISGTVSVSSEGQGRGQYLGFSVRGGYCSVVWVQGRVLSGGVGGRGWYCLVLPGCGAGEGIVWCCQGVVLILIWRLVPVPLITNGWYWHSLQGGQAQTQYISTSVRREDRGQSASQGLADTEIQNSVGNFSASTLSFSSSTRDKDTFHR